MPMFAMSDESVLWCTFDCGIFLFFLLAVRSSKWSSYSLSSRDEVDSGAACFDSQVSCLLAAIPVPKKSPSRLVISRARSLSSSSSSSLNSSSWSAPQSHEGSMLAPLPARSGLCSACSPRYPKMGEEFGGCGGSCMVSDCSEERRSRRRRLGRGRIARPVTGDVVSGMGDEDDGQ